MHFDLADLRLFIHTGESPSLTQGARRAFLSPAAASARVKALEAQLDTRLLYRDSRGVELTPAGQKLLMHARLIMRQVDYLKAEFAQFGTDSAGHIRIFANTTAVTEFLPEVLAGFLAKRPGVTVDLQERLSRDIVRGVLDGSSDMGIIAGPVEASGLQVLHFSTDRLVLIVPAGHELAASRQVTLKQTLAFQHRPARRQHLAQLPARPCRTHGPESVAAYPAVELRGHMPAGGGGRGDWHHPRVSGCPAQPDHEPGHHRTG